MEQRLAIGIRINAWHEPRASGRRLHALVKRMVKRLVKRNFGQIFAQRPCPIRIGGATS